MNTSFYTGVSGIKSGQFGIDVVANNISNISTIGFKNKTPEFSTYFATTLSDSYFDSTSNNVGLGSHSQTAAIDTSQGIFQDTDNVFDLAISGEGWFGVQGANGETFYTRAGEFSIDVQGNMVDSSGNYLLGTSGGNISQTTLNNSVLEDFGKYYRTNVTELGHASSISALEDVQLGTIETQSTINLPDILYFPPEATTYVNYKANLNPEIIIDATEVDLDDLDINVSAPDIVNETILINGSISNTSKAQNPKMDDLVFVTITDINGKEVSISTKLDDNLAWSIDNLDISDLDITNTLTTSAILQTVQEIPNVKHFTTEIISPEGEKNFIDMTFTKQVPQPTTGNIWDAQIQILSYFEEYSIEGYDPDITYDPTLYEVNLSNNQVTKIYDPALYKVDTGLGKVYEIIDSQSGNATFGDNGQITSSTIPTLSNSGVPLNISIGDPYQEESLTSTYTYDTNDNTITITGTTNLDEGKSINIDVTDGNGNTITTNATIKEDGSWTATYENDSLDIASGIVTNAYNIVNSGFGGIVSNVNLDTSTVIDKNGYIEGLLKDYSMDGNGNVVAEFSNGRSTVVSKVAVYHFQNDQGLENISSTLFKTTNNSGEAIFYTDKNGNNILGSSIHSKKLESSNVSMATALTELIILQKSFDSSAKCITTSDEMIQNAINMKR